MPERKAPSWDEINESIQKGSELSWVLTRSTYEALVEKAEALDWLQANSLSALRPMRDLNDWRVGESNAPTLLEAIRKARGDES